MEEHKTETKEGKNPEWNEAFDIDVKYVGDDMIIQVLDKCMEGDDMVSFISFNFLICRANILIMHRSVKQTSKPLPCARAPVSMTGSLFTTRVSRPVSYIS